MPHPEIPSASATGTAAYKAKIWAAADPDPETRLELQQLLAAADREATARAELESRFSGRLRFGTSGLRGPQGAGPMRMNLVVVSQSTVALGRYVQKHFSENASIVIGYDARRNSRPWALAAAQLLADMGLQALLLPSALPTPLLAFTLRQLRAAAGIMITASHNPRGDNGFKVYLGGGDGSPADGAQIAAPMDGEITQLIKEVAAESPTGPARSHAFRTLGPTVVDDYVQALLRALSAEENITGTSDLRICYTALYGVGSQVLPRLLEAAGFASPNLTPGECEPNPHFPGLPFPNPEEPGALDGVLAEAKKQCCNLVLANDPDADRLAAAVPNPEEPGAFRILTGDELGVLLAWDAAQRWQLESIRKKRPGSARPTLATTVVSSPMLFRVAEHMGCAAAETGIGFKWISRVPNLLFGYEEALGYLVCPELLRDKDGISAGLALALLARRLEAQGKGLLDLLEEISALLGPFISAQVSLRRHSMEDITQIMDSIRRAPPAGFGKFPVKHFRDYSVAGASSAENTAPANLLRFSLNTGARETRVLVRPSGTEPKLKCYLQVLGQPAPAGHHELAQERRAAAEIMQNVQESCRQLLEPR